jgi:hypothetical protein
VGEFVGGVGGMEVPVLLGVVLGVVGLL